MEKKIKPILILSVILILTWLGSEYYNSTISHEIKENEYETIAKVYEVNYGAKNVSIKYKYIYQGKIYLSGKPLDKINTEDVLNKYFVLHLSTKNPEKNKLFLNKEITDDNIILKAGI